MTIDLRPSELEALRWLKRRGGALEYVVSDKATIGIWNEVDVPGKRTMNKLIKLGLVLLTEEDMEFTPMYDVTDLGLEVLQQFIDK